MQPEYVTTHFHWNLDEQEPFLEQNKYWLKDVFPGHNQYHVCGDQDLEK